MSSPGGTSASARSRTGTENTCAVSDAELHVQRNGDGPPLLLIAGGLGAGDSFRALARQLASDYTVLTYDRRGHFRSTDRTTGPIPVARHAEDARAVITHFGYERTDVFGTSAGAQIALELAARFPEAVDRMIAHEPPAIQLLPDAEEWVAFGAEQVKRSENGDLLGAFLQFVGSLAGAGVPQLRPIRLPNEDDWKLLFTRELMSFYEYEPDVPALRRGGADITLAAGEGSRGYFHYTPAKILALELGLPFVEVPGAHLAPQRNPSKFAAVIRDLLVTTAG
ncbi:alpha/beta fold hydrolase [Amycolatopsis anabasis]|uniref:alpha/beta fold hydrolase n=1 Tax=Amycolatopsis anabasis TaxID=1840409 RepID=UPI00131D4D9E|nr:alpha/beta hydrolase [Amycolatopsis anabasis]